MAEGLVALLGGGGGGAFLAGFVGLELFLLAVTAFL
jgi:hypothetical protein